MLARLLAVVICLVVVSVTAFLVWPEGSYQRFEPGEAYTAQAEAYTVPDYPEDWSQHLFEAPDGTRLRWGETGNRASARATVLIVPGYTATLDMYGEHVDRLARRGYHVVGIDLRGQGMSSRDRSDQPEKLHVEDFSVYSDDLAAFIASELQGVGAVIPMGMSLGGHVSLRLAVDHPGAVDGLMLLAPALMPELGDNPERTVTAMRWLRRLGKARRYVPGQGDWRPVGEDYSVASIELCSSNPERLYLRDAIFIRRPEQRVGGVTVQWGLEFYESAQYLGAPGQYSSVDIPVHMIMAELDTFVRNDVISKACDDLSTCSVNQIAGTGHCLPQESDVVLEKIFNDLDTLVAEVLAR